MEVQRLIYVDWKTARGDAYAHPNIYEHPVSNPDLDADSV